MTKPPVISNKHYSEKSVFSADNLLREARRQKKLSPAEVPEVCVLDPDGDVVRYLRANDSARLHGDWACFHTELFIFELEGRAFGIVGGAVGAPFAVLVAEELFACGCTLLISVTSAGQIEPLAEPPYFMLIETALRDEGTSYHYLPPAQFSQINPKLLKRISALEENQGSRLFRGSSWTTDAPFRETASAIAHAKSLGIHAVEMEAAALYAFAEARSRLVVCLAHVTNQMACVEGDFEKGEESGSRDALALLRLVANACPMQEPAGE